MAVEDHLGSLNGTKALEALPAANGAKKAGKAVQADVEKAKKTYFKIVATKCMPIGPKGECRPADEIGNAVKVMRIVK